MAVSFSSEALTPPEPTSSLDQSHVVIKSRSDGEGPTFSSVEWKCNPSIRYSDIDTEKNPWFILALHKVSDYFCRALPLQIRIKIEYCWYI